MRSAMPVVQKKRRVVSSALPRAHLVANQPAALADALAALGDTRRARDVAAMRRGCVQMTNASPPLPLARACSRSICGTCVDLPEPVSPQTSATCELCIVALRLSSICETGRLLRCLAAASPSSDALQRSYATWRRTPSLSARCRRSAARASRASLLLLERRRLVLRLRARLPRARRHRLVAAVAAVAVARRRRRRLVGRRRRHAAGSVGSRGRAQLLDDGRAQAPPPPPAPAPAPPPAT